MAGSFVGRVLLIAGVVFFLYTAYAAMSHRERLRLLQREFDGLPSALFSNLVLSSGVLLVAGLKLWGNFAPIRVAENPRKTVLRPYRLDFAHTGLRAEAFAPLFKPRDADLR